MPRQLAWPERPRFLEGTFHWKQLGYSYAVEPPDHLLSPGALASKEPWILVASVLEHAKAGQHEFVARLHGAARNELGDPTLGGACLDLIADAGLRTDLQFLAEMMISSDIPPAMRVEACNSARWSAGLWLVEYMLECWKGLERAADREMVGMFLYRALEPLEAKGGLADVWYQETGFEKAVRARHSALLDQYGSEEVVVYLGAALDVSQLVGSMRRAAEKKDAKPIALLRRPFEANTGYDCSSFYGERQEVVWDAVGSAIDSFEQGGLSSRYEAGRRYFFGHPVPE